MKIYEKPDVIEEIKTQITIKAVCLKLSIARQTIYRWMADDKKFKADLIAARKEGIKDMNDECENRVIKKIMSDDANMIKFWLKHHHEDYKQAYIVAR